MAGTRVIMPEERYSPIDYFLENLKDQKFTAIWLTSDAYARMQKDEYLKEVSPNVWFGEEITIGGEHFPLLQYTLSSPTRRVDGCLYYQVLEIIVDGKTIFRSPFVENEIVIDY